MKTQIFLPAFLLLWSATIVVYSQTKTPAPLNPGKQQEQPVQKSGTVQTQQPSPQQTPEKSGTIQNSTPPAKTYTVGKKVPIRGVVINLTDYLSGGTGTLTSAAAQEVVQKAGTLALLVGKGAKAKIYLIVKADASPAASELARLADNPVGVVGKQLSRNAYNLIIADLIDTMK